MQGKIRTAILAAVLLAGFAVLAYYASVAQQASPGSAEQEPSMERVQNHSPVNLGDDEGRLEASASTPDAVLVACKRDPGQPTVYSRGRRAAGTHIYSVSDSSTSNGCNRNNTGTRLNQHWLDQGSLQSQVSNH